MFKMIVKLRRRKLERFEPLVGFDWLNEAAWTTSALVARETHLRFPD